MNIDKQTPYMQYESYETWLLYQEFLNIPGRIMDITLEPGIILSTEMMHGILNTTYTLAGHWELTGMH